LNSAERHSFKEPISRAYADLFKPVISRKKTGKSFKHHSNTIHTTPKNTTLGGMTKEWPKQKSFN
jgi:hypothetical protein